MWQSDDQPTANGIAKKGAPSAVSGRILLSHPLEGSILHAPDSLTAFPPFSVAGRKRQATCSDVAWFRSNHLAVVNLYGESLRIYRLHETTDGTPERLELLNENGDLARPEGVAVSSDGTILAVSHSQSVQFGITLHAIADNSLVPGFLSILREGMDRCAFHGVNFSPDGRYIAFTIIGLEPAVEVVHVSSGKTTCRIGHILPPLTPKSVAFSADGQFALIAYGLNALPVDSRETHGGTLRVHRFDARDGIVESEPMAEYRAPESVLGFIDMSTFLPVKTEGSHRILVADQGTDRILAFSFNAEAGTLIPDGVFAEGLSFPHGIDARADGRYVAITTYGDDSIHIARAAASGGEWV
jgi:6-phosphogluconolactonase (cycloisomerase 2 family)